MKDNFSTQAQGYAQYRPSYPKEMTDYVIALCKNMHAALDVATGNGQVATALAQRFNTVYATDISDKQLDNAAKAHNIIYSNQPAEHMDFADGTFDLITVAQAIHWFDFDAFYTEVKRLLKPGGIFAVMGYGNFKADAEAGVVLSHFYKDIVGPYWDAERRYIDENYTTIPFPFDEVQAPQFANRLTWTFEQLVGYLNTWSATQHYIKANGTNPVALIYDKLQEVWKHGNMQVEFPLLLRVGRKN
jgi:SAM-dependent methyltransferase